MVLMSFSLGQLWPPQQWGRNFKNRNSPEPQQLGIMLSCNIQDASQNPYFCSMWEFFRLSLNPEAIQLAKEKKITWDRMSVPQNRGAVGQDTPRVD